MEVDTGPGWKLKAEHSLPLDVRGMHRAGGLRSGCRGSWKWTNNYTGEVAGTIGYAAEAGGVELRYSVSGDPRRQYIAVEHTRCNFGGSRPWFICPVRGERVAVLYMRSGRFACRRCQWIAYASQSEDLTGRAWRKCYRRRKTDKSWRRKNGEKLAGSLHYMLLAGRVPLGLFRRMTGASDRTASRQLAALLKTGLLVLDSRVAPVRMGFPLAHLAILLGEWYSLV